MALLNNYYIPNYVYNSTDLSQAVNVSQYNHLVDTLNTAFPDPDFFQIYTSDVTLTRANIVSTAAGGLNNSGDNGFVLVASPASNVALEFLSAKLVFTDWSAHGVNTQLVVYTSALASPCSTDLTLPTSASCTYLLIPITQLLTANVSLKAGLVESSNFTSLPATASLRIITKYKKHLV